MSVDAYLLLWILVSVTTVCFLGKPIALHLRIMDVPGGRKDHAGLVPLVGGTAFVVGLLPVLYFLLPDSKIALTIIVSTFMLYLMGLHDDRTDMRPVFRLLFTLGVFSIAIAVNPSLYLEYLSLTTAQKPIFIGLTGIILTPIALTAFLNALNMTDGKNGIVLGSSLIWCFAMASVAPESMFNLFQLVGLVLVVLLLFNLKDKLFIGDSGAYAVSSFWGLMAVYLYSLNMETVTVDLIYLWFAIPFLDAIRLLFGRIVEGKSPFSGDRDHLHHLIYDSVSDRKVGLVFYMAMVSFPIWWAHCFPNFTLTILLIVSGFYIALITRLKHNLSKKSQV